MNGWVIGGVALVVIVAGIVAILAWPSSASADAALAADGGPTGRSRPRSGSSSSADDDLDSWIWDGRDEFLELS